MKIKAILRIIIPKNYDGRAAFVYTDTDTGKYVEAMIYGGESNITGIVRYLNGGEWEGNNEPRTYRTIEELPYRRFNAYTDKFPVVSGGSATLALHVKTMLDDPETPIFGS